MDEEPMSTNHIPFDLIADKILPELPAKSLLRFTSVCKNWYTFIKSQQFFAAHLHHKVKGEYPLILGEDSCYLVKNQEPIFLAQLDDPFVKSLVYYRDSAESCNGLISILQDERTSKIMLWNPSIRKCKKIYTNEYDCTSDVYGLGFHESSNEHRIVRIVYLDSIAQIVEVYSLGTDSWHMVDSIPSQFIDNQVGYFHEWIHKGVFLNGCIHWISVKKEVEDSYSIVLFDFESELFQEMALPKEVNNGFVSFVSVQNFEGSLAVLYNDNSIDEGEVWNMIQMTEYGVNESWTKNFSISLPRHSNFPVGFTKNGMLVYDEVFDSQLPNYRYNFVDFMTCESTYVEGCGKYINVIDYVESLALL